MLTVDILEQDSRVAGHALETGSVLRASFSRIEPHPTGDWTVTVLLSNSEEISELHGRFFGDATDTDVMSFPSGDELSNDGGYLGDIAISVDVAIVQAEQQCHSVGRELSYLALHGLLHLLGFRDDDEEQRAQMLAIQDYLLKAWEQERSGPD